MITPRVILGALLACAISTNARPQGFDPSTFLSSLSGGGSEGGPGGLPNPLSFLQSADGDSSPLAGLPLPPNPLELLGGAGGDRDARQSGGGFPNPLELIGQLLQPLIQKFSRLFGGLLGGGGGGDSEGGGGGLSGILSLFQPLLNLLQPLLDKLGRIFGPIFSTVLGALGGGGGSSSSSSGGDPGFKISIATTASPNEISGELYKRSVPLTMTQ